MKKRLFSLFLAAALLLTGVGPALAADSAEGAASEIADTTEEAPAEDVPTAPAKETPTEPADPPPAAETPEATEPEAAPTPAESVAAQIDALPAITYADYQTQEEAVILAREAYNALSETEREQVGNIAALEAAEARLAAFRAVDEVREALRILPDAATIEADPETCRVVVEQAETGYTSLSTEQQAYVLDEELQRLTDALAALEASGPEETPEATVPEEGGTPEATVPEGETPESAPPEESEPPTATRPEEGLPPETAEQEEGVPPATDAPEEIDPPEAAEPGESEPPATDVPEEDQPPESTTPEEDESETAEPGEGETAGPGEGDLPEAAEPGEDEPLAPIDTETPLPLEAGPIVQVVVPSSGQVVVNPYRLEVDLGGTTSREQIVTLPYLIVNHSNVPVQIDATATGIVPAGSEAVFVDAPPLADAEEKEVFMYLELQPSQDGSDPGTWSSGYDGSANQLVVSQRGSYRSEMLTLAAGDVTPSYALFRLLGSTAVSPRSAWAKGDTVSVTIVFTFTPLVP